MGRLSVNQAELIYPSKGGDRVPYFGIKNHGETKQVRFLYNTIDDIMFDVVHEVEVNGKTQTIACLNSDGTGNCPLCSHGHQQRIKLYIPVLDLTDNTVKIWTRSKSWVSNLQTLAARYNPISGAIVEVTRNGQPRDPGTTYQLWPGQVDGMSVEALGVQIPDTNCMMRAMQYDEMNNYANMLDGNNSYGMPAAQNNFSQPQMQQTQFTGGYAQPAYNAVQQPQAQTYAQPVNTFVGSEPVKRSAMATQMNTPPQTQPAAQASVPNYSNNMTTTPMQGIPQRPPVSQQQIADDDLPF